MGKSKLPTLFAPSPHKKHWQMKWAYLCTVDRDHRNRHTFGGADGQEYTLFLPKWLAGDHKQAHPNIGRVVSSSEGAEFNDIEIFVKHFTFEESDGSPKIFYQQDGVDYYRVLNKDVICAIQGDMLIPREGVLLCEAVKEKLYDTTLELSADLIAPRRDIVVVKEVWQGCTKYKPGDYVLLSVGADYPFEFKGTEYLKVDTFNDDIIAVVDSKEWRQTNMKAHKRITDHSKKHQPTI